MSQSTFDPDLLQPTLDSAHDADGFDEPWNPHSIVFASFFVGPIGGGALFAWNYKRLGQHQAVVRCVLLFAALAIVQAFAWAFLLTELDDRNQRRLLKYGLQATTVIVGLFVSRAQQPRYRVYTGHGGDPKGLLRYGILAFIVGGLLQAVVFIGVLFLVHGEIPTFDK